MQRLLALAIMLLVGLPAVAPLFALSAGGDPTLPACCRRDGHHHCMAGMTEAAAPLSHGHLTAVTARCPYGERSLPVTNLTQAGLPVGAAVFAGVVSHPSVSAQTESKRRISADRSRQKRGPPSLLLA